METLERQRLVGLIIGFAAAALIVVLGLLFFLNQNALPPGVSLWDSPVNFAAIFLTFTVLVGALSVVFLWLCLRETRTQIEVREQRIEQMEQDFTLQSEQLRDSNRYLQTFADKLREMNRVKSEFLANMSHELRSPLNSIMGYTELLLEENPDFTDGQRHDLQVVRKHAVALLSIINDLLDISRIEAGQVHFQIETFSLADLVRDVIDAVSPLATEKPLEFAAHIADDLPPVCTDRQKLFQVLFNLATNAVKFTEEGSITIRARRASGSSPPVGTGRRHNESSIEWITPKNGAPPEYFEIDVIDTGVGIDEDEQEEIFLAFRQADGSATRRFGGTGLGLAIAKKFLAMLCGTISLKSRKDEGSTFTVRLPIRVSEDQLRASIPKKLTRGTTRVVPMI